ncbi:hypothetical protein P280DRAFT_467411 [Massarina eburnea CBS 473.64]|uniref:Uncharacterized protein n=1 Tax=Massarina eburnea CBS 473.64 TaxID=1395130 RepID=A0A6A6S820_9PLEO|nr:hypothetical protein P280DRAFT_467411 [Massarina eburnea CBS 473.64]
MCRADPMIITMRWGESGAIPLANATNPHECVNWDVYNNWAGERKVDVFQKGYLVHPKLGLSFPEGHGSKLGLTFEREDQ